MFFCQVFARQYLSLIENEKTVVLKFVLISFFPRFSIVEHSTLLLNVGTSNFDLDDFSYGSDLERNGVGHTSHLCRFRFHIRLILKNPSSIAAD